MPDFNIKFKYQGVGKSMTSARTSAISASQKMAERRGAKSPESVGSNRELVSSIKGLNTSIQKLITSNKSLEATMKRGGGGGGGGSSGGVPLRGGGGGPGIGGMGASIPVVGAAIAGIGFAIQKINQVGNAYISLTSQQAGTTGVAGFRSGRRGMYLQTQQGELEKAHRMAAGRYGGRNAQVSNRAVQIGSIFGMGAGEIGRMSGLFARSGGNLGRTAERAAGSGIETEMPLFLQGMSSILEEAVTAGVNASNLADDIGSQVSAITQRSSTNSVGLAMNVVRNMRGVQQQVSRGQIGGYQQFVAYRAAGTAINQRLSDPRQREAYLADIRERGLISTDEITAARSRAASEGRSMTLDDLSAQDSNIGAVLRRSYAERGGADVNAQMMAFHKRTLGNSPAGLRRLISLNVTGMGIREQSAAWQGIGAPEQQGVQERGAQAIQQRFRATERSTAFTGLKREELRQGTIMSYGGEFAQTSLRMEQAMLSVVKNIAPVAERAIPTLGAAVEGLAGQINGLAEKIRQSQTPGGTAAAVGKWIWEINRDTYSAVGRGIQRLYHNVVD